MTFNWEIFRASDIRGIYGRDFDDQFAFKLGVELGQYFKKGELFVGHDSRELSLNLAKILIEGLAKNSDVKYLGLATTPFFNFVLNDLYPRLAGGIMVTASHNPPDYGGFKIFGPQGKMIGLESGLETIKELISRSKPGHSESNGRVLKSDRIKLQECYFKYIFDKAKIKTGELSNLKIGINFPPSAGGAVKEEIDYFLSRFNISTVGNGREISFSFDEDADRITVFDSADRLIRADFIFGVLVQNAIKFLSRPKVIHDLRFSRGVLAKFDEWGVKRVRSKVGRIFVREVMIKNRANLGGELSGHIYFKEAHFNELPFLAIAKILKILARGRMKIEETVRLFDTWFNSGEINLEADSQNLQLFRQRLKSKYHDGRIDEFDGLTVEYDDWWFNLRQSLTEPVWRLIVEAKTEELLKQRTDEIERELSFRIIL